MLQPAQLGRGRNVSCSNCQHVWFADPRDALPDPPPQRRQPMMAQPQGYPAQGYAPQGYAPQGYPPQSYPQQMAYGQQAPMMAPPPPQPAPPPPQPAPPPPQPAAMPDPMPEPEPEAEEEADDTTALPADINDMFEDDEEIEPFQSLITNDDEEDALEDIETPDQMDDPDYIPEVFSADEQEPDFEAEHKSPILKIILILFLMLIAAVAGGLFFFKDEVTKLVPQLGQVYEMIGFTQVGEGLQIQRESKARDNDQGIEVLVARGEIANVSDKLRQVPMLRAILLDGEEKALQHVDMAPIKSELKPGERISFKLQIREPSPLARRMKVTFIDPKDAGKPPQ